MSSIIGIGYENLGDAATLGGPGWSLTQPVTNLQDDDLAVYAETTGTTATIIVDLGSAKSPTLFALSAHTCADPSATLQLTGGTTSGGSEVYPGSAIAAWPFTPLDYDGSHFPLIVYAPNAGSARYWQLVVSGSASMRFGRLSVMRVFLPDYSPEYGSISDGWQDPYSTVDRAGNGADLAWSRRDLRSVALEYPAMTHAQGSAWHEIQRTHGITGEVFYLADTQDRERQQQFSFLGRMRKLGALENPFYRRNSAAVAIDERGGAP
ncbi:MAG: hypothetical protein KA265_17065 [Piscinibacter sp.]|nr:hypothetical protein [Piscinibacter sp.]